MARSAGVCWLDMEVKYANQGISGIAETGEGAAVFLPVPTGHLKTFRELYCERHRMAHDQFERTLVWRSLHWQARPFYWLLRLNRDYFSADYEFVRGVGELRSRRQFHDEVAAFQYHPDNRRMLRKSLRMRVSGHRLQDIFENEIKRANTATPF